MIKNLSHEKLFIISQSFKHFSKNNTVQDISSETPSKGIGKISLALKNKIKIKEFLRTFTDRENPVLFW